jgi:hypothetical protein
MQGIVGVTLPSNQFKKYEVVETRDPCCYDKHTMEKSNPKEA